MTILPTDSRLHRWTGDVRLLALVLFGTVAVTLFFLSILNVRYVGFAPVPPHGFPDYKFFEGWTRWDSNWYYAIAEVGYYYHGPDIQASVAFFPGYPLAMRAVGVVVANTLAAGVVVTYLAGAAAAVTFASWCRGLLGRPTALIGVALLVTYPFAFYLMGAVYSDAFFLAAALGAFLLLERGRPELAGLLGAVATATRPVGIAVVIGLGLRALELRGFFDRDGSSLPERVRKVRPRDLTVGLSLAGLGAYCYYLWSKFGEPLAFQKVASAPGWSRKIDWHTISKADFINLWSQPSLSPQHVGPTVQAIATFIAIGLTVVVWKRLGIGYAAYNFVVVAIPAFTSKDFIGTGRYVLVAFPAFAAAAALLQGVRERRGPALGRTVVGAVIALNIGLLVLEHSYFVRWYFFS